MAAAFGGAVKPRRSGTPYRTAESCRGCRLDRLETASYWLVQIKIAESSTKHFASAAFFRLALPSSLKPSLWGICELS
ncbi:hypothetical protein MLD38_040153 [Melastoma candidum]|uniref:Uncharacterized protein n=1 Tax=Melastoma candidum TaxID=119954 RepID=A0ACB9L4U1_9MYRT|nr:hypothetical protein MLD38_040153 [Melastoma candidum]